MSDESAHEKELGGKLLASVSRSFYLTLKALPRELREPISLAYLLARTADTLADTAQVDAAIRLSCLQRFSALVQADTPDTAEVSALAETLRSDFCPHQTDSAEATLMRRLPEALTWLGTMRGTALHAIRQVLRPIVHGQCLDIQRFPSDGHLHTLATEAELDEYTWLVAGCVGEFWTQLCFSELGTAAFIPSVTQEQACAWGAQFGKGLQLVNILRDLCKDARLGRCYIPSEEWPPHGLTLAAIERDPLSLQPACTAWMQRCEAHLDAGLQYVQSLAHSKLRYATALPLLLGVRTLALLRTATETERRAGVKMSRLEVGKVLLDMTFANSPQGIAKLYQKMR
jgi:farnesyl-diphosphate farnesyltransferase